MFMQLQSGLTIRSAEVQGGGGGQCFHDVLQSLSVVVEGVEVVAVDVQHPHDTALRTFAQNPGAPSS